MLFHFIDKALATATAQSVMKHTPPPSSHASLNQECEKQGATDLEAGGEKRDQIPDWKPQRHEWLVMITLATVSLMVALDATILVPVLPTLAVDLHGTANEALWTATSYLLTSAVFQPFLAALSDIFGRRELLFPSLLLFTTGTAICCAAHNFTVLLIGRCVQGIGGGGIITLSQVIFADIIPLRQRPKYLSLVLGAWAFGSVLGPFIGGLFVSKASWRWCFYLNFPFCVLGAPMVLFLIPLKTAKTSLKAKFLRVDWLGGFLFIGGLTSFLIAITWGGVQFAWTSWRTLVPLTLGLTAIIVAIAWERYGAIEPFLRHSLFHSFSAVAAYVCALLQGLLLFTALYYLPFWLTAVLRRSPIQSGLDIFPATCLLLPGSAVVALLITRLGHFRLFVWLGWLTSTTGTGLSIVLDQHTKTWHWALIFAIYGLGMGMILSSINFATQAHANVRDAGRAAAMYTFMRSLGMAVGVAISGSVFQNLMATKLAQLGLDTDIARDAEAYVAVLRKLEVTDPSGAAFVLSAYQRGFWGVFMVLTGICALGLAFSLCIKHRVMDVRIESQYTLDRTSRTSKLLDGASAADKTNAVVLAEDNDTQPYSQRASTLLGEETFTPTSRQSKVALGDETAVDRSSRLSQPEAAAVRVPRSPVDEMPIASSRSFSEEVVRGGTAKEVYGLGPM